MKNIETFCTIINNVAEDNWMTAYISNVGFKEAVIKVCPANQENTPLLVLRHQAGLYLVRHKNNELTDKYKGSKVSLNWVIGFIKANFDEKNKDICRGSTSWGPTSDHSDSSSGFYGRSGDEAGDWRDWKK